MLEAQSTFFEPQTIGMGNITTRNQTATKLSMYYTECHHINHNMETCRSKKKEEPIIVVAEAIT